MRSILALVVLMPAVASAADRPTVPASQVVEAARSALQSKAQADGVAVQLTVAGTITDVPLLKDGTTELHATVQSAWLRPRIGIPVQVQVDDQPVTAVTVWFAISAPAQALVYTADAPRGTPAAATRVRTDRIDLARTHGASTRTIDGFTGQRLQRAVTAGDPVLPTDFEPTPDVQVRQLVRVEVTSGPIHLTTSGQAMADGRIGQTISVLPAGSLQPVRARVVSNQAVTIEN